MSNESKGLIGSFLGRRGRKALPVKVQEVDGAGAAAVSVRPTDGALVLSVTLVSGQRVALVLPSGQWPGLVRSMSGALAVRQRQERESLAAALERMPAAEYQS